MFMQHAVIVIAKSDTFIRELLQTVINCSLLKLQKVLADYKKARFQVAYAYLYCIF
jgi:hypothetical protein